MSQEETNNQNDVDEKTKINEEVVTLKEKVDSMEKMIMTLTEKIEHLIQRRSRSTSDLERKTQSESQGLTYDSTDKLSRGEVSIYQQMLKNNKSWAQMMVRNDPNYFMSRSKVQKPHVLWIGCSDSRVHPSDLTGLLPGEIFVHRNIANQCYHNDLNMLSVVQYAVEVLKVPEIVVVGHYGCGGVQFAMKNEYKGLINQWTGNIKEVYAKFYEELEPLSEEDRFKRLVELNVIEQATALCKTSFLQKSWKTSGGTSPRVHAWVYDLADGLIKELNFQVHLLPFQEYNFDIENK